jgi:hypothetical protein
VSDCIDRPLSKVTTENRGATASLELATCRETKQSGTLVWLSVRGDHARYLVFQGLPTTTDVRLTWETDHNLVVTYPVAAHPQTWPNALPGFSIVFRSFSATGGG